MKKACVEWVERGQSAYIPSDVSAQQICVSVCPAGTIVVALKQLDREVQSLYVLTVTASDTVFTATASVTITVSDVNDNSPTFTRAFYSFEVRENADIGATVARVTALDADEGENAQVSYEMLSNWGREVFQLDSVLGTFTLIGSLDYETVRNRILCSCEREREKETR